jgi:hypothetical protein
MAFADTSRSQLLISAESAFDETPASPAMQNLRFTSESLKYTNATAISEEIRSDRSRSDLVLLGIDTSGSIGFEMSAGTYDAYIEAALCGTWNTTGDAAFADGNFTAGQTAPTYTITSASATFATTDVGKAIIGANIAPNSYIVLRNSATSVNLNQATLGTGTSQSFTIKARTSTGNRLKNGTTFRSFLLERGLVDAAQYFRFLGTSFDGFNLSVDAGRIVTGSFDVMGAETIVAGTSIAASTTAQSTTSIIGAGPQITGLETNTNMTGIKVTGVKLSVKNNLRARHDVQTIKSAQFGMGVCDVTGSLTMYFQDASLFTQFIANSAISFAFSIADPVNPANRKYTITLPKMKLPDLDVSVPGIDQDVMQTIQIRGLYDPVNTCQIMIDRL